MSESILVGGEPMALLAASSSLYEIAARTDDVGRRLAGALGPATSTILSTAPYAPMRAAAVGAALADVLASPASGLVSVAAAYQAASLQLRSAGQALEAAGAVGLLASGGLGLLRGERPTVLDSAEGVDLRRETATGSWSIGPVGGSSSLGVREVEPGGRAEGPGGPSIYVVELTTGLKQAESAGIQVNGIGAFAEGAEGSETIVRWAVATRRDAELLLAAVSAALIPGAGALLSLPKPSETVLVRTASTTAVGALGPLPGLVPASATAAVRAEVTTTRTGAQRFAASVSVAGQVGVTGVTGSGAAGSVRVAVDRDPAGAVTRASVSTTTEVDRGRHGMPLLEAGNREATLVEREWEVQLTPEGRAAADRVAAAVARGVPPDPADLALLHQAPAHPGSTEHTYDTRHQQMSADVAVRAVDGGGGASVDTAVRRD